MSIGATAITVAGAHRADGGWRMVTATRGLFDGALVVFWALGNWLIPALVAAGGVAAPRAPHPAALRAPLWSVVCPLGMYGVGGRYLGQADHLPLVKAIGADESWVALAAWLLTFLEMLRHLVRTLLPTRVRSAPLPS